MSANTILLLLAALAIETVQAASAAPDPHREALDAVAAVVADQQAPETARRYFSRNAIYVNGDQRVRWDIVTFRDSLRAGSCRTTGRYWARDQVLNGVAAEARDALRQQGHPEGPALSFYCADGRAAGAAMMTFKFERGLITQVRQAFFVHAPAFQPQPSSTEGRAQ